MLHDLFLTFDYSVTFEHLLHSQIDFFQVTQNHHSISSHKKSILHHVHERLNDIFNDSHYILHYSHLTRLTGT
jgi:hypothetical protein